MKKDEHGQISFVVVRVLCSFGIDNQMLEEF